MNGHPRVLVVDQDFETRAELQKGLVRAGFIVVGGVGYGAEALSLAGELNPSVVLVGLEEPAARALQTIESLAELLPDSPILVYSSLTDADSARRAMVAGARDYLTKPLKTDTAVEAVQSALSLQERRQAVRSGDPAASPRSTGMVVTVFGAKGGIGKTTMAVNLATALVAMNAGSAVIVDFDTVFGDVAMMLDVPVELSLVDAAARFDEIDRDSIGSYLVRHPSGVNVLPAPFEPVDWRNVSPDAVGGVLALLAQTHDFVIVDCPATLTDLVAVALDKATVVLLLTSLDITSLKDSTTALKLLNGSADTGDRVKLVVNRVTGANSVDEEDVSKVLQRDVVWSIPHDEEIAASAQLGKPLVVDRPASRVSETILEMAAMLAGLDVAAPAGNGRPHGSSNGVLARLFRR